MIQKKKTKREIVKMLLNSDLGEKDEEELLDFSNNLIRHDPKKIEKAIRKLVED